MRKNYYNIAKDEAKDGLKKAETYDSLIVNIFFKENFYVLIIG